MQRFAGSGDAAPAVRPGDHDRELVESDQPPAQHRPAERDEVVERQPDRPVDERPRRRRRRPPSGLGDLVLTATSASSRNYAFGLDVGKGVSREDLYKPGRPLAEGIATAPALVARAHTHKIELPIAQTTAEILAGKIALADAIPRLMSRPLKTE